MKKKAIIELDDVGIQKQNFHQHKGPISIENIDITKIVVSNNFSFGKKKEFK